MIHKTILNIREGVPMQKIGTFTKLLTYAGLLLVWFPIFAPLLLTLMFFVEEQVFQLDYLMPAELFLFALGGSLLLLWAAIRMRSRIKIIGWGLGVAVVMLVGGQALAVATGLASGETAPDGWEWALVMASLAIYTLAIIANGVGGIQLLGDQIKREKISQP